MHQYKTEKKAMTRSEHFLRSFYVYCIPHPMYTVCLSLKIQIHTELPQRLKNAIGIKLTSTRTGLLMSLLASCVFIPLYTLVPIYPTTYRKVDAVLFIILSVLLKVSWYTSVTCLPVQTLYVLLLK